VVDRDYVRVVVASVKEAHRWRREYEDAKAQVGARASPDSARRGLWKAIRQPHPLATSRQPARTLVAWLAVQGERSESRSDTSGALDRQTGDRHKPTAGGRGLSHEQTWSS
jgi:hypothetical protein